jgi:hypothetical protein
MRGIKVVGSMSVLGTLRWTKLLASPSTQPCVVYGRAQQPTAGVGTQNRLVSLPYRSNDNSPQPIRIPHSSQFIGLRRHPKLEVGRGES